MKREWLAFLSAVQFLTRLPIPDPGWEDGRLDRAAKWFPVVGIFVGVICGAAALCMTALNQSASISILVALSVGVVITGALHEDGLADTADGLGGGRDREHRLVIMKDSSIGSYGAIALILAFGFRFIFYGSEGGAGSSIGFGSVALFVAAHCVGRAGMLIIVSSLDYVRDEAQAKVAPLTGNISLTGIAIVAVTLVISLLPLLAAGQAIGAIVLGFVVAAMAAMALRILYLRKLGGWTGDTAGATQIVCEIAFLIGLSAWT